MKGYFSSLGFRYRFWGGRGDLDAFFGLFFDSFSRHLAIIAIMLTSFRMSPEIIFGRVFPAMGIALFIGSLWYAYEAWRLARSEKRQDVTAQPFGNGQGFAWTFLIIGAVYWQTGNSLLAWQVGIAACFIGGLVELSGAFLGTVMLKRLPSVVFLGNVAAVALIWMGLVSILFVFNNPSFALPGLFIMILGYWGGQRWPFRIPTGVLSVFVGVFLAWSLGHMDSEALRESFSKTGWITPNIFIADIMEGIRNIAPYLSIVIPLQIMNFLTTLQSLATAEKAGDCYPPFRSLMADGVTTIVGSCFGNPFPTTVYYGHPGWKKIGARSGYVLLNGLVFLLIGLSGFAFVILALIPYEATMPIIFFLGLTMTSYCMEKTDTKYYPAFVIAMFPMMAQYIETITRSFLQSLEVSLDQFLVGLPEDFSVPLSGILALSRGGWWLSLLLAGFFAALIDRRYFQASLFSLVMAFSSFFGFIHASNLEWFVKENFVFTVVYLSVAAFLYGRFVWEEKKGYASLSGESSSYSKMVSP